MTSRRPILALAFSLLAPAYAAAGVLAYVPVAPKSTPPALPGRLMVVDTETAAVVAAIDMPAHFAVATAIAVPPDGTRVYVAGGDAGTSHFLWTIDTAQRTVLDELPLPDAVPGGLAVRPDHSRVFVSAANTVRVYDHAMSLVTVTSVPGASGVAAGPLNHRAYVLAGDDVVVLDATTGAVLATKTTHAGCSPHMIDASTTGLGTVAYLVCSENGTPAVYQVDCNDAVSRIGSLADPALLAGLVLRDDGNALLVAEENLDQIAIFDVHARTTSYAAVGRGPLAIDEVSLSGNSRRTLVTNLIDGTLTVLKEDNLVMATLGGTPEFRVSAAIGRFIVRPTSAKPCQLCANGGA
jgi:DNA-binding beta-propeller fold protein YncE